MTSIMAAVGIALLAGSGFLLYYSPRGGRVRFPMTIPIVEYFMPIVILIGLAIGAVLTAVGSGWLG